MKSLEKSITLAVSLKVVFGNVKYIFNIDILLNYRQNNISAVGEIFWRSMFQLLLSSRPKVSWKEYS